MQTLDVALVRTFAFTERLHTELRGEAFNALNHSNWGTPNRFVNTPQFGTITEATTPGREFQLSAGCRSKHGAHGRGGAAGLFFRLMTAGRTKPLPLRSPSP